MSVVRARDLAVGYDGRAVATVAQLTIGPGDRVIVAGPNGSGKTTVLKTLARLLAPVAGTLEGVGAGPGGAIYVHPSPFLFEGSGLDNVLLGAHGARDDAMQALDALDAAPFARAHVRTMSNGQRQRIALARALAARPALLLLDEADSGLDGGGQAAWRQVVATRRDIAIVVAAHRTGTNVPGAKCYVLGAGAVPVLVPVP
jgi:ABC-type Mn2+/Zn2+ transport system ATPase subunit